MKNYKPPNLSRKIAGNVVVKANRVIRVSKEDTFQFRAYEPGRINNYLGHLKYESFILGEVATKKKGGEKANHKKAISLIHTAFPEIAGLGLVYSGYIELKKSELPEALKVL